MEIDKTILDIDLSNLAEELGKQANLFFNACEQAAIARKRLDDAKNYEKYVRAETAKAVRDDPAAHGLRQKPNKDEVDGAVEMHPKVQEIQAKVVQRQYNRDVLLAVQEALKHKRDALSDEVYLLNLGYNSEPRIKGPEARKLKEEMDNEQARKRNRKNKFNRLNTTEE